jgi:hypothetical protein
MPAYTEKHPPGNFVWVECATSGQEAGKKFYTSLFGWTFIDAPMGPGQVYTMFKEQGKDVAALFQLGPEHGPGTPPHWGLYVSVDSADEAATQAAALGGKVVMPPFDVFDAGRMCVLQDPTGAIITAWQAKSHLGVGIKGEINSFCWGELATRDTAAAGVFYSGLFGWGRKLGNADGFEYTEWLNAGESIGGMYPMQLNMEGIPPHWLAYFRVADCDATLKQAADLGATVLMGPMDIPKVGRFAVVRDPQGAVFAVIKLG